MHWRFRRTFFLSFRKGVGWLALKGTDGNGTGFEFLALSRLLIATAAASIWRPIQPAKDFKRQSVTESIFLRLHLREDKILASAVFSIHFFINLCISHTINYLSQSPSTDWFGRVKGGASRPVIRGLLFVHRFRAFRERPREVPERILRVSRLSIQKHRK